MAPRVLTSLVGIPILVGAIWWGPPWLTLLVLLVAVQGVREVYQLAPTVPHRLPLALGALWVIALVLGGQASSGPSSLLLVSFGILLGGAFVSLLWLIAFHGQPTGLGGQQLGAKDFLVGSAYLMGGPIYVGLPLAHALGVRDLGGVESLGRNWLLFALLVTFASDSGAYLTGRAFGRHRMAISISPNKTWEGAGGGFVLAVVAALALGRVLELGLPLWQQGAIACSVGVAAQLGDLFESKLKRISGAKDAGNIIPGHGGVLDRLDSLVTSVPVVYYLLALVFRP